jgi:hypothetical protein
MNFSRPFTRRLNPESASHEENRASFQSLVKAITDLTAGAVDGEQGRQKLLKAIRNLIAFVEPN